MDEPAMNPTETLENAAQLIRDHNDLLLICHVSPDGDTLGSALALFEGLVQMDKRAQIVCEDAVPAVYRFLPNSDAVVGPGQARQTDAVIAIDCADLTRAGKCVPLFLNAAHSLNIDHHGTNDLYADGNYVRECGATGELIFELLGALGVRLTRNIAACLYAALTTDTGNFAYSNTTPQTLRIAASLLETGIDLPRLNRLLFRTVPYHKVKLRGLAISKMALYENGRIGLTTITNADMEACRATAEDTEGIIDSLRDIDTVEIACLLREGADGYVRVSLRGKCDADVSKIAMRYHGGGHRLAAGCSMLPPIDEAAKQILDAAIACLHETER